MDNHVDEGVLANFEIHDNTLICNVELYWENHSEFLKYCDLLLKCDSQRVVLDLTPVTFVFSAYMGTIGRLLTETARQGKRLSIRVNSNLVWLFEMVGFEKMVDIEVVHQ